MYDPAPASISVTTNGALTASFLTFRSPLSPAFLAFDAMGHVAARHIDSSLVGPPSLYPGYTTPAKVGETISVYGTGLGAPIGGSPIMSGSATQTGNLLSEHQGLDCYISGV